MSRKKKRGRNEVNKSKICCKYGQTNKKIEANGDEKKENKCPTYYYTFNEIKGTQTSTQDSQTK